MDATMPQKSLQMSIPPDRPKSAQVLPPKSVPSHFSGGSMTPLPHRLIPPGPPSPPSPPCPPLPACPPLPPTPPWPPAPPWAPELLWLLLVVVGPLLSSPPLPSRLGRTDFAQP